MYCTIADITDDMTLASASKLSNDADPSSLNKRLIEQYITDASDAINGYLRGRYPLPLSKSHIILKKLCIDLVKYELYKRRGKLNDDLNNLYKDSISTLGKLQKGQITLDEGDSDDRPKFFSTNTNTQLFTDDLLDKY